MSATDLLGATEEEAERSFISWAALNAGLPAIEQSPKASSVVDLIVRRSDLALREAVAEAYLDATDGLLGDNWSTRGSSHTRDGSAHPERQLTIMNARAIALLAGRRERWPLAGDQLYVDLDLSAANLPAGTQLSIGEATVEITPSPHLGCAKFKARFGTDAFALVNSEIGRALRLRGVNARIVSSGAIRVGDKVWKIVSPALVGSR